MSPTAPLKRISRAVPMPGANGITVGSSGTFLAQLNNNNVPIALPPGSSWDWSTDDPSAIITLEPSDPTGGTVNIAIPASDTTTSIVVTAATTDPNGTAVTGSLTVPISPGVSLFTVTVTQTA